MVTRFFRRSPQRTSKNLVFTVLSVFIAIASCGHGQESENPPESETSKRLRSTVSHLSEKIGERNLVTYKKLQEAADYVEKSFESMNYKVERQPFMVAGMECHNLVVEIVGGSKPEEIVIVGAHYDSARGTPGANDNGTGVAALIEIANQMRDVKPERTIRFVAFANEEPPYFQRDGLMGSWVYAKTCRARGDDLQVVISLETMGYYSDAPQSQKYPPILAALYPSTGNFIGFVSNMESRSQLLKAASIFRKHCKVDAQHAALPGDIKGVGWSDHWSFWQEGYPGIMVTDTAPFRYPHYHLDTDTIDKIVFDRYAQVVDGLAKTIVELVEGNK